MTGWGAGVVEVERRERRERHEGGSLLRCCVFIIRGILASSFAVMKNDMAQFRRGQKSSGSWAASSTVDGIVRGITVSSMRRQVMHQWSPFRFLPLSFPSFFFLASPRLAGLVSRMDSSRDVTTRAYHLTFLHLVDLIVRRQSVVTSSVSLPHDWSSVSIPYHTIHTLPYRTGLD